MATLSFSNFLHSHLHYRRFLFKIHNQNLRVPTFSRRCSGKVKIGGRNGVLSISCLCKANVEIEKVPAESGEAEMEERPPFDINLAVILAGFAFEAYTSPPVSVSIYS
ncbi:hypothetical protein SLEP1_g43618 [Rubroshorea leprosula]|uniref:Uncharacterized protein n=1 Tax=Rubroshorea leprosula TaxID=152421 RepID=A0AAV5LF61_9ROSI|nr:hypothetical protein SLEP1_g43618 [Rubroshorea leprosula]